MLIAHVPYLKIVRNITPRFFGHVSILQCSSLFWNCGTIESRNFAILSIKLQSHVRIFIYRTWTIGNVLNEREMGRTFEHKDSRNRWEEQQRQMIYVMIHFIIRQNNVLTLQKYYSFYSPLFYFKCFIIDVVSSFAEVDRKQIITLKINKRRFKIHRALV